MKWKNVESDGSVQISDPISQTSLRPFIGKNEDGTWVAWYVSGKKSPFKPCHFLGEFKSKTAAKGKFGSRR